ncbi:hypothetical protein T10_2061 [Trichinella papuae]|uniref:Uncharacterized protein n=1 Tax=Trichinella papuae TaxID=268474 RepID=A0A0V1N8Q3_9BILA|nr:hypothetical protein T10_2061 [Trichinella papuae]
MKHSAHLVKDDVEIVSACSGSIGVCRSAFSSYIVRLCIFAEYDVLMLALSQIRLKFNCFKKD